MWGCPVILAQYNFQDSAFTILDLLLLLFHIFGVRCQQIKRLAAEGIRIDPPPLNPLPPGERK